MIRPILNGDFVAATTDANGIQSVFKVNYDPSNLGTGDYIVSAVDVDGVPVAIACDPVNKTNDFPVLPAIGPIDLDVAAVQPRRPKIYTLYYYSGSQSSNQLFYNTKAGTYRITVVGGRHPLTLVSTLGFAMTQDISDDSIWNYHIGSGYQGGGIYISLDVSPYTPIGTTLAGFTASGFSGAGNAGIDLAIAYSYLKYTDMYLPAGQLYWYFNDNPTNDNRGVAQYEFSYIGP